MADKKDISIWIGYPRTYALLVDGTNINTRTLLATDYLNHFNEAVMLVELVPDMPDCLEDLVDWKPKSYQQHFFDSGLSDGPLAAWAYENSPPRYRDPFDEVIEGIGTSIVEAVAQLNAAVENQAPAANLSMIVDGALDEIHGLMSLANAIIHGGSRVSDQATIDSLLAESGASASTPATPEQAMPPSDQPAAKPTKPAPPESAPPESASPPAPEPDSCSSGLDQSAIDMLFAD